MSDLQSGAFDRLRDAFPRAGATPAALVDTLSTCDQEGNWRAPGLAGVEVLAQDVLDALVLVRWARSSLEAAERKLIDSARGRGMSWKEIAVALELDSPQGAQRRRQRLGQPVTRRRV